MRIVVLVMAFIVFASTAVSAQNRTVTAFKTGERTTGMTKQCFYDALGNGYTRTTLPAGLQILARPYQEGVIFRLAYAYEQGTLHRRTPDGFPTLFLPHS